MFDNATLPVAYASNALCRCGSLMCGGIAGH
jgi:hypothetical protein